MPQISKYIGDNITVSYDRRLCIHAGECVRNLPQVFDTAQTPWVHPNQASASELKAVIERCPSGALTYTEADGSSEIAPQKNTMQLEPNGPLHVRGHIELLAVDGTVLGRGTRFTLCRCGASKHKPFCDNSHNDIGFSDPGTLNQNGLSMEGTDSAELKITALANGPFLIQGKVEIVDHTGTESFCGNKAGLCRCGGSANKPFCDGTHRKIGFQG